MKQIWKCSLIIAFLVMGDQLLKGTVQSFYQVNNYEEVTSYLWVGHTQNYGFLFGTGVNWPSFVRWPLLYILPVLLQFYFLKLIIIYRFANFRRLLAYTLITTGLFGNFLDRIIYGHVVDFISIGPRGSLSPSFNTSDIFIVIGAIIYLYLRVMDDLKDEANPLTIK
tara:strand:- start:42543 stop:43043 length:501 start_codon:yes stop_codon:yes gene_type:complete